MAEYEQTIPPLMMLRSFLTVGSGYAAHVIVAALMLLAIGQFFPEFTEFLQMDQASQEMTMQNSPHDAVPRLMFWLVVAATAAASIVIGALVAITAPFSPLAHAAFVAVILFVTYLQKSIGEGADQKSMSMIYMMAFPAAVMAGGFWVDSWRRRGAGQEAAIEVPDSTEPDGTED